MAVDYEISAHAKINLFLRIKGCLPNGYHKLVTMMQEIGLSDIVRIRIDEDEESSIHVKSIGEFACTHEQERDLCFRAAERFTGMLSHSGKACRSGDKRIRIPRIDIEVTKNIPSQAGLGGGSSDAAGVLAVLQKHFGCPFTERELVDAAFSIGADVPFFLYGGTAFCEGVGEIVMPAEALDGLPMLLVKPACGIPTVECFAETDKRGSKKTSVGILSTGEYLSTFAKGGRTPYEVLLGERKHLINDLESAAKCLAPEISELTEAISRTGAGITAMSGSGSAVFGIYGNEEACASAEAELRNSEAVKEAVIIRTKTTASGLRVCGFGDRHKE